MFKRTIIILLSFVVISGIFPWIYKQFNYKTFWVPDYSPDKQYKIEYYSIPYLPFEMSDFIGIGLVIVLDIFVW